VAYFREIRSLFATKNSRKKAKYEKLEKELPDSQTTSVGENVYDIKTERSFYRLQILLQLVFRDTINPCITGLR